MTNTEAHISESVRIALEELGEDRNYDIVKVSVADDGQWCARLEPKDKSREGISACISGDKSDPPRNVNLFKDKISRWVGLSKMITRKTRSV